jgi:hypothetical protein
MTIANDANQSFSLQNTELKSSFNIPIALTMIAIAVSFLQVWVGVAIAIFGLFLTIQAATLKLIFTETDLDIYRGEKLLRRFPYKEWLNWRIFFSPVPILFYFRETKSIHFLPILFDPKTLEACLEKHCFKQE